MPSLQLHRDLDHASECVSRDGELMTGICNIDAYEGSCSRMPWAASRGGRGSLLKLEGEKSSAYAYSLSLQITLN